MNTIKMTLRMCICLGIFRWLEEEIIVVFIVLGSTIYHMVTTVVFSQSILQIQFNLEKNKKCSNNYCSQFKNKKPTHRELILLF